MEIIEIKRTEGAVTVEVRFRSADYMEQYKEEIRKIRHEIKLPGFRPGQVPASLVQHRFGEECHREALSKAINEAMQGYVQSHSDQPTFTGWYTLETNVERLDFSKAPTAEGEEFFIRQMAGICRPMDFSTVPTPTRYHVTLSDADFERYLTEFREDNPSVEELESIPDLQSDPSAEVMLHCEIYRPEGAAWGEFELKAKGCPLFMGDALEAALPRFTGLKVGDTLEVASLKELLKAESRSLKFAQRLLQDQDLQVGLKIDMINGRGTMPRTVEAYKRVLRPDDRSGVKLEDLDTVEKCEGYLRKSAEELLAARAGLFQAMKYTVDLFREWAIDLDPELERVMQEEARKELLAQGLEEEAIGKRLEWELKNRRIMSKPQQYNEFLGLLMAWERKQAKDDVLDDATRALLDKTLGFACNAILHPIAYMDTAPRIHFHEQALRALMTLVSYGQEKAQELIQQTTMMYYAPLAAFDYFPRGEEINMDAATFDSTFPQYHHYFDPQGCMWTPEELVAVRELEQEKEAFESPALAGSNDRAEA